MEIAPALPTVSEIKSIAIDQLKPNPWNRTLFSQDQQAQVAKELKDGKLKPQGVEKRCNQLRFGKSKPHQGEAPIPDPLANVWPDLQKNLDFATALEGGQPEPILSEVAQATQQAQKNVLDALGPLRLPKTPEEQKELEELAKSGGPKAVYACIYGKDSPMVQAVPASTWKELGMTPQEGLKQVLDGIRQFLGSK